MDTLTQERLKEVLSYNPGTGAFTWLISPAQRSKVGMVAGGVDARGYRKVRVAGCIHKEHRLAFLYMEGKFPPDQVDHINRVKDDNRWENLRYADARLNCGNTDCNVSFVGVNWRRDRDLWRSVIFHNGKKRHLGYFKTHLAACYARHAYEVA